MLEFLLVPFESEFMRRAALASVLLGALCGPIGAYVVLRRMSFMAGALCHTILPGIAFGYFQKLNLFLCALASGVLAAVGISALSRSGKIKEDTAIGVVFTAMFALGIIYISTQQSFRDLTAILFGNILAVNTQDIFLLIGLLVLGVLVLWSFHKELVLTTVDEEYSRSIGIPVEKVRMILVVLIAIAVVAAIQSVGVVLTAALLITPAAGATMICHRLPSLMVISATCAISSGIAGLYCAWYLDLPAGPSIVLCATVFFLSSWLWNRLQRYIKYMLIHLTNIPQRT